MQLPCCSHAHCVGVGAGRGGGRGGSAPLCPAYLAACRHQLQQLLLVLLLVPLLMRWGVHCCDAAVL
jgi:hypothetical protein